LQKQSAHVQKVPIYFYKSLKKYSCRDTIPINVKMPNKTGPEIGRQQNRQNILQIAIQPAKTVALFCSQSAFLDVLKCIVKLKATKNNPYID
jgi:hypothetical protein